MNSLKRLIDTLKPLGLYNLTPQSLNYAELAAYAAGLDDVAARLDALYAGRFIDTATGERLDQRLRQYGVGSAARCTDEEKRTMLHSGGEVNLGDGTAENLLRVLSGLGVVAELIEYAPEERIRITVCDYLGEFGQPFDVYLRIRDALPCHLAWDLELMLTTFDEHDGLGLTFNTLDGYNESFDETARRYAIFWEFD